MQEADVVKIVESSIAKKNEGLLAAMKSMLDNSLADFKRSHAGTADTALKCGIAGKRRTLICISLNNKRITKQYICYMPRSFKL